MHIKLCIYMCIYLQEHYHETDKVQYHLAKLCQDHLSWCAAASNLIVWQLQMVYFEFLSLK